MEHRKYVWMDEPDADTHVSMFRSLERERLLDSIKRHRHFADEMGTMIGCVICGEAMLSRFVDLKWAKKHLHGREWTV
jgi:hypothetical protein